MNSIKILGINYKIVESNLIEKSSRWAEIEFLSQIIRLEKDMSNEQHDVRLIHEIIHAVLEQNGITWQNESVIQTIASGLYNTLKENKGMFKASSF